jgi:hypothetical protein
LSLSPVRKASRATETRLAWSVPDEFRNFRNSGFVYFGAAGAFVDGMSGAAGASVVFFSQPVNKTVHTKLNSATNRNVFFIANNLPPSPAAAQAQS